MPGVMNDYLIFPILDIVKSEIHRNNYAKKQESKSSGAADIDLFKGIPSVILERNHPNDSSKTILTKAAVVYPSGWGVLNELDYGDPADPNFTWILKEVNIKVTKSGEMIMVYNIRLNYDDRGMLTNTVATKLAGIDIHY